MNRAATAVLLSCACTLVGAMPCAADIAGAPPPGAFPAGAHYRRGLVLKASRRYAAALGEFKKAIGCASDCIPAHREYQNLMLALGLQEELVRDYGAARRREPRSASAGYLYGRLLDDPAFQDREFRRVIGLDPRYPWGHCGVAMNRLIRGDRAGAEEEIDAALGCDPSCMQARAGKAFLESLAGRRARALELYREPLRDEAAPAELFEAALAECRDLDRTDEGAALSAAAASRFPECPSLAAYRGYFLARTGDRPGAVEWYEKAVRVGPLPFAFARDLRRLYAESGRHAAAVGLWRMLFGTQLGSEDNRIRPLWRRVESLALPGSDPSGPGAFAAIAEAYEGMGWWAEAAAARRSAGEDAKRRGPLAADEGEARVVDALAGYGKWLAARMCGDSPRLPFRRAVGELARVTAAATGGTDVAPGAIRSRAGVRWFGDAPGRPQPLIDRLRGGNREIVFFENIFARRMTFEVAEVVRCALARRGPLDPLHWETTCLPSGSGATEEESGLTYPPFEGFAVFYDPSRWSDLCEVRRAQEREPLGHSWFLDETGRGPLGPREVVVSRMLEKRLFEKLCRSIQSRTGDPLEGPIEDRYALLVAAHEREHLGELRRFLPVWRNPARCIGLAARALCSPRRIERWFEERATARSLTGNVDPDLWLLTVHAQLRGETGAHADASRRVLEAVVGLIAARPDAFPGIDCRRNILNQLYLLDGEALRTIVLELYGGRK